MPELPEVETIRRALLPRLVGARVTGVTVRERRLRRPIDDDFEAQLRGRSVTGIERRGKYLLFRLDDGRLLIAHLGMSGRLTMHPAGAKTGRHDHATIDFDRGVSLSFNDPRRFGLLRLARQEDAFELAGIGRDLLVAAAPTGKEWRAIVRGRRQPIKNLLMDQRLFGGVGNIYASEALFRAGIRPRRSASRLSAGELDRLGMALRAVLEEAVSCGGSSISDYRLVTGELGSFQVHHAVYARAGEPCRACGSAIKRVVLSGRSSFYCPRCQR